MKIYCILPLFLAIGPKNASKLISLYSERFCICLSKCFFNSLYKSEVKSQILFEYSSLTCSILVVKSLRISYGIL